MLFSLLIIPILAIVIFNLQSSSLVLYKPEPIPNIHPSKSLPFPLEHFIGREKEMDDLIQLLAFDTSNIRGVSVVGPPGVGKSTLAIHTGRRMEKRGMVIHYVDLYQVHDISSAMLKILWSVEFHAINDPVLVWARRVDTQTILILDNCDDILHGNQGRFQGLVKDILRSSSLIKTLLTTKQMASFLGEFRIYRLRELSTESAIALLRNIDRNIEPSQARIISELVGRMPLALQVLGSLLHLPDPPSSKVIITELQRQPIAFLSPEELPETEQVQTSIHISYSYLNRECKNCIRLLANFPGSFTMEAARSVLNHRHASDCVDKLQKRSLLVYYQHTSRFQFHRLIKEYILILQRSLPILNYEIEQELFWVSFLRHYWGLISNVSFSADVYTLTEKWKVVDAERHNFDVLLSASHGDRLFYSLMKKLTVESDPVRELYSMLQSSSAEFVANQTDILKRAIHTQKTNLCHMADIKLLYSHPMVQNDPELRTTLLVSYPFLDGIAKHLFNYLNRDIFRLPFFEVVNQRIQTPWMIIIDLFHRPLANDIGHEEYVKMYTDILLLEHKMNMFKSHSGAPEVLELRHDRMLDLYSQYEVSTSMKIKLYTKFYSALATAYILDNKHLQFMDCWRAILQVKKTLEPCRQRDCSHSYLGLAYYGKGDYEKCVHHLELAWQASEGSTKKRARYLVVLYHAYKEIGTEEKALQVVDVMYKLVLDEILNFAGVNAHNYRTCVILSSFLQHLNTQKSMEFAEYLWHIAMRHVMTHNICGQNHGIEYALRLLEGLEDLSNIKESVIEKFEAQQLSAVHEDKLTIERLTQY